MQGVVRTYDPVTGVGVVVADGEIVADGASVDRQRAEILLRPGSLAGSIFRLLRQGQRIVFDVVEDGSVRYVANVRVGQDGY